MAALEPAFTPGGVTTAGNSSQISDGAAAVLVTTAARARELGLRPRARLVAAVTVGSDPHLMLTGPIAATQKALRRAGLTMDEIDVFEVNEAFASVPRIWQKDTDGDMAKVNIHGGAIALGAPARWFRRALDDGADQCAGDQRRQLRLADDVLRRRHGYGCHHRADGWVTALADC